MKFQAPQLGALGVTFTALRALQLVSLIAVIGMTGNFVSEIASAQRQPPDVVIGALILASIATLYTIITYILYYDELLHPLMAAALDLGLTIATIVIATLVGQPLPSIACSSLVPNAGSVASVIANGSTLAALYSSSASPSANSSASTASLRRRHVLTREVQPAAYFSIDQPHCYEAKAVWGLEIVLCVLFGMSALVCVGLWRRARVARGSGEGSGKTTEPEDGPGSDLES